MENTVTVHARWDDEARVWVAENDDMPGLAMEAASVEAVIEKLKFMMPRLLDESGIPDGTQVPFRLLSEAGIIAPRAACG
ncbi:MAG: DUF1902 domain-containing protein [Gammaproteobacteria bacterium]|nr:DUF1902 domain-containing protein [Gammaproteobacteria bacterium]